MGRKKPKTTMQQALTNAELDAKVYKTMKANMHRPQRAILALLTSETGATEDEVIASLGRLYEQTK